MKKKPVVKFKLWKMMLGFLVGLLAPLVFLVPLHMFIVNIDINSIMAIWMFLWFILYSIWFNLVSKYTPGEYK